VTFTDRPLWSTRNKYPHDQIRQWCITEDKGWLLHVKDVTNAYAK